MINLVKVVEVEGRFFRGFCFFVFLVLDVRKVFSVREVVFVLDCNVGVVRVYGG